MDRGQGMPSPGIQGTEPRVRMSRCRAQVFQPSDCLAVDLRGLPEPFDLLPSRRFRGIHIPDPDLRQLSFIARRTQFPDEAGDTQVHGHEVLQDHRR